MKLCKDCKYCRKDGILFVIILTYDCFHPSTPIDPVTGKKIASSCEKARSDKGLCGPGGKLWEAK